MMRDLLIAKCMAIRNLKTKAVRICVHRLQGGDETLHFDNGDKDEGFEDVNSY